MAFATVSGSNEAVVQVNRYEIVLSGPVGMRYDDEVGAPQHGSICRPRRADYGDILAELAKSAAKSLARTPVVEGQACFESSQILGFVGQDKGFLITSVELVHERRVRIIRRIKNHRP